MSLVKFPRTDNPVGDLKNKIRHVYDIYQMLKDDEIHQLFDSSDFDEMLLKVGSDDMIGYKNNSDWLLEHPSTALIFEKPQETRSQLSFEYNGNFKDLVIGDLPTEEGLIEALKKVATRLKKIKWELK